MNWLSRLLLGSDEEYLRDLYNERDLLIATHSQIMRDLERIDDEIREEERKAKKC